MSTRKSTNKKLEKTNQNINEINTQITIPQHAVAKYKNKTAVKVAKLAKSEEVNQDIKKLFKDNKNPALQWVDNYFKGEAHAHLFDLNNPNNISASEMKNLIDKYFLNGIEKNLNLSVTSMASYLGVTTPTLLAWSRGDILTSFQNEIQRAIQAIHAYKDDLAERGMINPVVHIFNSKNFYGMRDVTEHHSNVKVMAVSEKEKKNIIDKMF